jgi:hypothetical protein
MLAGVPSASELAASSAKPSPMRTWRASRRDDAGSAHQWPAVVTPKLAAIEAWIVAFAAASRLPIW